jgi:ribonuclease BN (tRNA processing enzyme)
MKVVFLGTNGWYTSPTGNTPCVLIDSKTHYVIFDAGNGIYKLDKYITEDKPIALFISHFHIDHVSGLHTLNKFNFPQGIDIYVAKGRKKDFDTIANRPYTIGIKNEEENVYNLDMNVRLHELEIGNNDIGFPVKVHKLYHAYEDHGYKITLEGKTVAYSGDTRVGPESFLLAENADMLIHECSYIEAPADSPWGHVDPQKAATLAKEAKIKQLVLTHFDASLYTDLEMRKVAQDKARKIFPNTITAVDDLVIEL